LPLFSFSKTNDYWDISFPAWTFWAGGPAIKRYPTGLGRWDLLRKSLLKASEAFPWDKKSNIAFFRGSRTSNQRDNLILLSRKYPDLIDAKFTKNQAWKSNQDTLGEEPSEEVSLEDHCQHKYLFNFRGVAASFRFKHLFLCGSLVIHVGSEWTEFFYPAMKPWIHYVPIDSKASQEDILNLLTFLRANEDTARQIANAGKDFIEQNLSMDEVECYWRKLLTTYTSKLNFAPTRDKSFIEIK
jgi:protein glucosyltransferase